MVKFAKGEEKPFDPIEKNTINSLAAPVSASRLPCPFRSRTGAGA